MNNSIRNIILSLFFILYSFAAYTQNKAIDSLQKMLAIEKEDTNKVNTMLELSHEFDNINDDKNSILYGNESLLLAEKIGFEKGKANA